MASTLAADALERRYDMRVCRGPPCRLPRPAPHADWRAARAGRLARRPQGDLARAGIGRGHSPLDAVGAAGHETKMTRQMLGSIQAYFGDEHKADRFRFATYSRLRHPLPPRRRRLARRHRVPALRPAGRGALPGLDPHRSRPRRHCLDPHAAPPARRLDDLAARADDTAAARFVDPPARPPARSSRAPRCSALPSPGGRSAWRPISRSTALRRWWCRSPL